MSAVAKFPWLTGAVCLCAAGAFVLLPRTEGFPLLVRGAGWREGVPALWTTQLLHLDLRHLLLNLCAGGLAFGWLELLSRRLLAACLLVAAPVCAGAALLAMPELESYRGLSGLAHAAAGALLALAWVRGQRGWALAGLCVAAAKLLLEFRGGSSLFLDTEAGRALSTPPAHLAGLLCGLVLGLAAGLRVRSCGTPARPPVRRAARRCP